MNDFDCCICYVLGEILLSLSLSLYIYICVCVCVYKFFFLFLINGIPPGGGELGYNIMVIIKDENLNGDILEKKHT